MWMTECVCAHVCRLTCPRVCAVDLRLCGVSEDAGSYTVEAVFVSVILQSCLVWAHRVVLAVASTHNQLRDTELLLQYWDSRAITYRRKKKHSKHKHTHLFQNLYHLIGHEAAFTISVAKEEAFPLFGRRADPLLKVGRVSDVEHVVDVHGQCQANVVVVTPVGGAGDHGAHWRAAVQGALVDGTE